MKILLICQHFYPEQFRVNDICFELAKQGHQVTVLTGLPNYPSGIIDKNYRWFKNRKQKINGVEVIRCWLIARGKSFKKRPFNYVSFAFSSTIKAFFIKKDFDLVLVYQLSPITMALPGILLNKITKKPLIIYCHDLWPESLAAAGITSENIIYKIMFKVSKWMYKSAGYIFISSKLFEEYFNGILDIHDNITYLPAYAETLFEDIDDGEEKADDTINLLFAGNIGKMQSVETIIRAANELKEHENIKFHIVGDGSSRQKCEDLAQQLDIDNVVFYGQHPITEMPRFYKMADAFLVTLKQNRVISYTLPNKVQSYMAAGKPIIAAIDGETSMVINDAKCGLCCPAEDYKSLADNIIKFVQQREKHSLYGNNARKYYNDNFCKKIYMQRLNNLLEEIILDGNV